MSAKQTQERRKHRRTLIQESFPLFIVIPKSQGMSRIYLRDVSRSGLCFFVETESDYSKGQELELRLYTSPAFYLPLECKVIRVKDNEVAVEFKDANAKSAQAVGKLQEFIELALDATSN